MGVVNPDDPRAKRTKKYIQDAFVELLKRMDFEDISVHDIMSRAQLNRATFYNHFQDKQELLEVTMTGAFSEKLSIWIPAAAPVEGADLLRRLLLAVCEWQVEATTRFNSRRSLTQAIEESAKEQLYLVTFDCLKVSGCTPEEQRKTEWIATMISWSIYGVVEKWSRTREEPAERFVGHILPFLMSSLLTTGIADRNSNENL